MNSQRQNRRSKAGQWVSLATIGLGTGWLTGLSASPVLAVVLTSILGAAAGLVAGAKTSRLRPQVDASPLAVVVFWLALSAPLGILARTHRLFSPEIAPAAPTVTSTLPEKPTTREEPDPSESVLFSAASSAECDRLVGNPGLYLRSALQTSSFKWAPELEAEVKDDTQLRRLVNILCSRP